MIKKFLIGIFFVNILFAQTPLEYLNDKRLKVGMTQYTQNTTLNQSAQNHANYVSTNIYTYGYEGHYETSTNPEYTGVTPWDRAFAVNYESYIAENMTVGYSNYESSIDGLFTAIYHRLGFLDFFYNEIGIAQSINTEYGDLFTHVYNLGNTYINSLCNGDFSYLGYNAYYTGVCERTKFRIEASLYDQIKNKNILLNPDIVTWPYSNQIDFQPAFFEESPDPLPSCSVTGNPISIQFNPLTTGTISLESFQLFDENNNEITNTTIMDESSDINNHFTDKDFALFPMKRLDYGSKYSAKVIYKENNILKEREWSFYTKTLDFPYYIVNQSSQTFNIISGNTYMVYIPPIDCNDSRTDASYYYSSNTPEIDWMDANTLKINVTGNVGQNTEIRLANGKTIILQIANTDNAVDPRLDTDNGGIPDEIYQDNDNDTISDSYEIANGLNPLVNDANGDLDSDGKTNLEEYQDGTKANDANSRVFTLNLISGWNLVALELNSNIDISSLNNSYIQTIKGLQNGVWKDWDVNSNSNTLTSLEDGYGYWIKVSQDTSVNILGDGLADSITITPNQWNMIGSQTISDINQFFTDNPNVKVIWKYDSVNQEYKAISSDSIIQNELDSKSIPNIISIESIEGFFVK
ncbi:MAG: CAP domain-containing protein [Halarcobacter sp.]